jgi:hypothetical protein
LMAVGRVVVAVAEEHGGSRVVRSGGRVLHVRPHLSSVHFVCALKGARGGGPPAQL